MEDILKSNISEGFDRLFCRLSSLPAITYLNPGAWRSFYRFIELDGLLITWINSEFDYGGFPSYSYDKLRLIIWKDTASKFCEIESNGRKVTRISLIEKQVLRLNRIDDFIPEKFRNMNGSYHYCKNIGDCTFAELIDLIN